MWMTILCFFTIFCKYASLMEIGTGNSSGQKLGIGRYEVSRMDFKANPKLAKIFELYDLLAIRGPKLFAHPAIVDDPEEVLKSPNIIDELPFHERMSNFAGDFQKFVIQQGENTAKTERELTSEEKKHFIKIKYPNTALFLLICAIKNEITGIDSAQLLFYYNTKEQFVNEMIKNEKERKGNLEEEYAQLRKDPYFPEKLPKIFNLLALLEVLPKIMVNIVEQIKPKDYKYYLTISMSQILLRIKVNLLKGDKIFIASQYKRAVSQIPNIKLRNNLGAIRKDDTIYYYIFKNDIKYKYEKWYNRLKFYMLKYLAEKHFDVSDLEDGDDREKIRIKIGKKILEKTLSHILEGKNTQMEEQKKNELLTQLHLRIFCVGISYMDNTKQILLERYSIKGLFYALMYAELLEIVPRAMEKFNKIIAPKEELAQKNPQKKMNLFFEAVSKVRREICKEKQWQNEKH